jgi:hypothetical protein
MRVSALRDTVASSSDMPPERNWGVRIAALTG